MFLGRGEEPSIIRPVSFQEFRPHRKPIQRLPHTEKALGQMKDITSAHIATISHPSHKRRGGKTSPRRDYNKRRRSNSSQVAGVTVQDRYYSKLEYAKLSASDRQALYKLRLKDKQGNVATHQKPQASAVDTSTTE
jgi:hypothetical protein